MPHMKKKILVTVGILALVPLVGFIYLNYRNRSLSPPGEAKFQRGDFSIEIPYSRPSKKGRVIFGSEEKGALLPDGVYWRLGANEATEVTFNNDVVFNGVDLDSGAYRMYAFPNPNSIEISLNSELGKWGYMEPDYMMDVLKTTIPVEKSNESVEQFTIRFEEQGSKVMIVCEWSFTKIKIPVEVL
jgi:hypothetical protein